MNSPSLSVRTLDYRWRWVFRDKESEDWFFIVDLRWWYDHLDVMPAWIVVKARIVQ